MTWPSNSGQYPQEPFFVWSLRKSVELAAPTACDARGRALLAGSSPCLGPQGDYYTGFQPGLQGFYSPLIHGLSPIPEGPWPQHVQALNVCMAERSTSLRTETAAVRRRNEGGWDTWWSDMTWGGMTHTYWNCFRCHWCWMSLPLQANKKETLIQNTPLRGHMQHKTQDAPGARH